MKKRFLNLFRNGNSNSPGATPGTEQPTLASIRLRDLQRIRNRAEEERMRYLDFAERNPRMREDFILLAEAWNDEAVQANDQIAEHLAAMVEARRAEEITNLIAMGYPIEIESSSVPICFSNTESSPEVKANLFRLWAMRAKLEILNGRAACDREKMFRIWWSYTDRAGQESSGQFSILRELKNNYNKEALS